MYILDLFAGKGGEQRRDRIESLGHDYTTLDINPEFGCDITEDIMTINLLGTYDFIWASPPCESWSVAAIGHHWAKDGDAYLPKTEKAKYMIKLVEHTIELMQKSCKIGWLIENPRGMLRKMPFMQNILRQTVTYCQYGETRMKPTDIWTYGLNWKARPICKNGDTCHESSPRGSRTGTQGVKGYDNRSIVPWQLWEEVIQSITNSGKEYKADGSKINT